jgi:hypothetical protein
MRFKHSVSMPTSVWVGECQCVTVLPLQLPESKKRCPTQQ